MEDAISLIGQGCKLARIVESNLPNLAAQPQVLATCCDAVSNSFGGARDALLSSYSGNAGEEVAAALLEQINQVMEMLPEEGAQPLIPAAEMNIPPRPLLSDELMSDSAGRASSSPQRSQRRERAAEKRVIRVPAPRVGNTEIPPEDGFTWRKYGQKEIFGCRFPRGYFKCTHQKLYQCQAKKHVQRLDDDPYTYQVTYRGEHTCHMSATAPSAPPPPQLPPPTEVPQLELTALPHPSISSTTASSSSSVPLSQWLSIDFNDTMLMSSGSAGTDAGPSTVRYGGKEAEVDRGVVDLVDAMFNSGGGNSMELIFPSAHVEEKREPEEGSSDN
uniref:WRKY transcription factor 57 n=1 Tax=Santalum album TaxID=35974 RepID=A0A650C2Y9_SANAL|nr:WRKY transcription factor 57 [Santalum album]